MLKFFLILFLVFIHCLSIGQVNLVLYNDVYVRIYGGTVGTNIFIVIANSSNMAVATTGSGGRLVTEGEYNRLKWLIGTSTGNYVLPFADATGNKFAFEMNVTSAATGFGHLLFSTYGGNASTPWSNASNKPSGVSHFLLSSGGDGSSEAIDRFWLIDPVSYTVNPTVTLKFNYKDNEWNNINNTNPVANETNLKAQRFNTTSSKWGDFIGGSDTPASDYVNSVTVSPSNFYRSWTLANSNNMLPIELIYFGAKCIDNYTSIEWITASETNNDFFTIESSVDGINFIEIDKVKGSGNSNSLKKYSYKVYEYTSSSYFRLKQVDVNGDFKIFNIISANCEIKKEDKVHFYSNGKEVYIFSSEQNNYNIRLYDDTGRLIFVKNNLNTFGDNSFTLNTELSTGIYFINLFNNFMNKTHKMIIKK